MSIRRVYLDCEFLPADPSIRGLVSIGLTDNQGRDYYAVNSWLDQHALHQNPWMVENVWPYLPTCEAEGKPTWLDIRHPDVKAPAQIRTDLVAYFGVEKPAHLHAWYGAQDIGRLHSLWDNDWEKMPRRIPRWFHELQSLAHQAGDPQLPVQDSGEHHALADAKYNRQLHEFLLNRRAPHGGPVAAREQIETALMTFWGFTSPDELGADRPRRLLDQYAHELAETIRAWAPENGGAPEYGSKENVLEAADLIDPEARR